MTVHRILVGAAFAAFVSFHVLIASDPGSIRGKVLLGEEKEVQAGVQIKVLGHAIRTQTSQDGSFFLPKLVEGTYELDVSFIGYKQAKLSSVRVQAGSETNVTITLAASPFLLNEIVVTGSLNKHLLKDTPVTTELITERDIAATGSSDLSEVMRAHTGVEIATSIGQTPSARLNGLNKNQVLVLVDGERVSGKVDGAVNLGQIPTNTIDKIEVVKGPLSSIYGTDALGGVINIITKNPKTSSPLHLASTYGSYGRQDYELSVASSFDSLFGENRGFGFFLNTGWNKFAGVDYDSRDFFMEMPQFSRLNADVKTIVRIDGRLLLDLKGQYYKDEIRWLAGGDRIVSFVDAARNEKVTLSSAATYLFSGTSTLKITAHATRNNHWSTEETSSGVMVRSSLSKEEVQTYRTQLTTTPYSSSILTFGYEFNKESANSARIEGTRKTTTTQVLYGEDEWTFSSTTLVFGARYSSNSSFGGFVAPRVSILYRASDHLTLRGSYGRGFRAPSLLELFIDYDNSGVGYIVRGEPNLLPETSHGFNAGLDYSRDDVVWFRVNAYYNLVADLIGYYRATNTPSTVPILSYRNIEKAVTKGADVDVDIRPLPSLTIALGYTYLSATDGNGNSLPFHAANSANVRVRYVLTQHDADGSLRARWRDRLLVIDDQVNTSIYSGNGSPQYSYVPSAFIVDLRLSKKLFESFELSGGVNNLFDTTQYPFGQIKGRELFASLTYTMK